MEWYIWSVSKRPGKRRGLLHRKILDIGYLVKLRYSLHSCWDVCRVEERDVKLFCSFHKQTDQFSALESSFNSLILLKDTMCEWYLFSTSSYHKYIHFYPVFLNLHQNRCSWVLSVLKAYVVATLPCQIYYVICVCISLSLSECVEHRVLESFILIFFIHDRRNLQLRKRRLVMHIEHRNESLNFKSDKVIK